ncbi:glycosyltransferase family 4 protein [Stenotrophomonas rhizophila]|jgi:glycosyltransferase involved in cell wall biosynthesis|uniref:glycosyltransferase family 4 protein n=1 Tax=Stenotrophomonas rhizophila TaxID=216778 RepID=UPI001AEBF231|nr:glycosyltransferase family 1 protein [Stenotrophomonas rhizophila]
MRILLDLQGAQGESRLRGIGRYSMSLALAVARNRRAHDVHLLLNGAFPESIDHIRQTFDGLVPRAHIHVLHVPLPVFEREGGNELRNHQAEVIREAAIASVNPDVVHVSSLFEGFGDNAVGSVNKYARVPTVVTLYDMIPLMNSKVYLDGNSRYSDFYHGKLANLARADALVAISESSAAEAHEVAGFPGERIYNISAACDRVFCLLEAGDPLRSSVRSAFGLHGDFVLYTGGADRRKNLDRLIQAYAGLENGIRAGTQLVLAGHMPGPQVAELRRCAADAGLDEHDLIFTGYISDQELVGLYNECSLFVFPSWHEGFGLPVLEAMACGAPVIASDASSIREIATEASALFDPHSVDSMRERMEHFLASTDEAARLRQYSIERATVFSWDKVAENFVDACERVAALGVERTPPERALRQAIAQLGSIEGSAVSDLLAAADGLDRSCAADAQLLVDVTELADKDLRTGIQRVTRAVLAEWAKMPPRGFTLQLVRLDRSTGLYVCANQYAAKLLGEESEPDVPAVCHPGDVFLGLDLVGSAVRAGAEWFTYLRRNGVKVCFVVYDILPVRRPEWWPGGGGQHHEAWLREILNCSDQLICISRAVADDVRSWMQENDVHSKAVIDWFHLGADLDGSVPSKGMPDDAGQVLARLSSAPSFLMVGTIEPRKGHEAVLAAFDALWADGHDINLVIIGRKGWLVDALCQKMAEHERRGHQLFWFENASDEYLDTIYAASSCLIAASEGEGFGLPLIEAAQRGLPIIARDIPVFREVAGEHAHYFDGTGGSPISAAVTQWLELHASDAHPRSNELPWLTWGQSATQLKEVLLRPEAVINGAD